MAKREYIYNVPGVFCTPGLSLAVKCGDSIHFTGQVAYDEEGNVVGKGDMKAQIAQAFSNMTKVLEAAGATLADIVKLNLYVGDMLELDSAGGEMYSYIKKPYPAITGVEISRFSNPDFMIEIDGVAVIEDDS